MMWDDSGHVSRLPTTSTSPQGCAHLAPRPPEHEESAWAPCSWAVVRVLEGVQISLNCDLELSPTLILRVREAAERGVGTLGDL